MKRLGAILAGGKASRFGSDKAAALLGGRPLIEHVAGGLRPQVDELIICGREWPGTCAIADRPTPGLGPLGGLNAALHHAQQNGFGEVLTAACDVLPVPEFPRKLSGAMALYADQHFLFGAWPAALAKVLDRHLSDQEDLSMRHWITTIEARAITFESAFNNLNTPDDVAKYAALTGMLV